MVCWPGDIFTRQVVEFPAPVSDSSQQINSIHESFKKTLHICRDPCGNSSFG